MTTIDNPAQIADMLTRPNAPSYFAIWRYVTGFGGEAFKLIYRNRLEEAVFLATGNIKRDKDNNLRCECLWDCCRIDGLTEAGERWLESYLS